MTALNFLYWYGVVRVNRPSILEAKARSTPHLAVSATAQVRGCSCSVLSTVMFSPNLSNRGKAAFVVGIVIVVSLFWFIGPKNSPSQDSGEVEKAVKAAKGGVKGQDYKMAGNVEVHLSKETKLLSPPLPSEVEARKDSIAVTEGTVKIDVSTSHR